MQKDIKLFILAIITCSVSFAYKEERSILERYVPIFRLIKTLANDQLGVMSQTRTSRRLMVLNRKLQHNPFDNHFPCNLSIMLRSKERPKSAHTLRPGDIDVIGALGDSLTAGLGVEANQLIGLMHEGRGSSFSVGGSETWMTRLTLPNILRNYNPQIYGYSLNSITIDRRSKFNVAEAGAMSADMPYMAKVLVKRIKNDKNVKLEKDWKMITVFIGHNDFCSMDCYMEDFDKVLQDHKKDMLEALRIFRDNLPRTVINFIPPFHLRNVLMLPDKPQSCRILHLIVCSCLTGLPNLHLRTKMMDLMTRWQQLDLEIAGYPEFDKEDFTVIAHKFTLNFTLPRLGDGGTDYGYFAPDCFHASQRGHAKAANDLWNSLLEPYGSKSLDPKSEFKRFLCPSEANPYIFTRRNSNKFIPTSNKE